MTAAFGVQAKRSRYIGGRTALARQTITPKEKRRKNIERPEGAMVYVSMDTSEGIIEGNTANAGLSDLSPLPIFGGGETRHENAEASKAGGSMKLRHPASNFFMKKLLLLPLLLSNALAQDGSFNGTVYDLDSGRIQVISGSVDIKPKEDTYLSTLRRINAELAESNARMSAEIAANNQLYELREQTRLLRKIADQ
jgi:hypothetical protein